MTLPCDLCQGTGYSMAGVDLEGMQAGEEPKMVVTFKPCELSCPADLDKLKEWFSVEREPS